MPLPRESSTTRRWVLVPATHTGLIAHGTGSRLEPDEQVEVMSVSEHEEEMEFLRRARDNAEQAWADAEEERDRLHAAALAVVHRLDVGLRGPDREAMETLKAALAVDPREDE